MRIDSSPLVVAGRNEGVFEIEPVSSGKVAHPPMGASAMIEDHVHHYLHAVVMGFLDKGNIFIHGPETGIHGIVVGDGIAVIGPC